jgi:ABC-type glycerol-3-phosphate transport system substrate-binding protein
VNGLHPNEEGFDPENVAVYAFWWTWPRYMVPTIMWQFGGGVVNEDVTQATLNSPETVAAVQFLKDLSCEYNIMNRYQTGVPWAAEAYANNQIAVWWEGTWTAGYMRDNPDVAAVSQALPINSLAPDGNQAVKFDAHVFSVPTGVDDAGREAAYSMVQFLVENGAYWATSGQVPALKSVQELPEVQALPSVATAAEQFNQFGRTDTASARFIEIQTAWETAIGNAMATAMPMSPRR